MLRPVKKWLSILSLAVMAAMLPTMAKADEEFDSAKWKLQLNGWVSQPAGYFNGAKQRVFRPAEGFWIRELRYI